MCRPDSYPGSRRSSSLPPATMATWPSGKASVCKTDTPGSNPGVASSSGDDPINDIECMRWRYGHESTSRDF